MKEASWVPAALTAVTGCTGYAAMCWALDFLTPLPDLESAPGFRKVMVALLIHEAWVTFQHANVLFNPFCQQLDRRYGVSMLRKGQHWVIASVLVMYWCREVFSMLFCLPYISLHAQVAVFVSVAYHTVKMLSICKDAQRCWSPTLGIMKLLIDHWHFQSLRTQMVSLLRMALQGYDTFTHVLVVRDLINGLGGEGVLFLHITFCLWLLHAVMNQISQKSTATLVVETWRHMLGFARPKSEEKVLTADPVETCVVCDLLHHRAGKFWKDAAQRKRSQSGGCPSQRASPGLSRQLMAAIFTLQIGSTMYSMLLFILGGLQLGTPLSSASISLIFFLHEGWVMLQHANVLLNPFCQHLDRNYGVSLLQSGQHWVIAGVLVMYWSREVLSMLFCLTSVTYRTQVAILVSSTYHLVKMYSICVDAQRRSSPTLGIMRLLIDHWHNETLAQLAVSALRIFLQGGDTFTHVLIVKDMLGDPGDGRLRYLHLLFVVWIAHAALNQATQKSTATLVVEAWRKVYRPVVHDSGGTSQTCRVCSLLSEKGPNSTRETGAKKKDENVSVDLVFLSHPAYPSSLFSLWWPSAVSAGGWKAAWWMQLVAPPLSLLIPILWPWLRNGECMEVAEDIEYSGIRMQNWVLSNFGYQYVLWPFRRLVEERIVKTARLAEHRKVSVLCLGALNKAEWMNNGGLGLLVGSTSKMRIVHGNTLTAAAVVETAKALFGDACEVFVTGASSKVGTAVVLSLLQNGFEVLAHSSDSNRSKKLLAKCRSFDPQVAGRLRVTTSLVKGVHVRHWVVGKSDRKVLNYVPQGAKAVVFSVPNPFESGRRDVLVLPGGILHMDLTKLSKPRQFSNLLEDHEIYACHAAGVVAAANPNWLDELGEVRLEDMSVQWKAALKMGFSLPEIPSQAEHSSRRSPSSPAVIVVGGGPSGLAAAAALVQKGEDVVVLERQKSIQGGWCQHFDGLTITTRASTCGLPDFPVKLFTCNDELKGTEYVDYLVAYAARFALDVRCNMEVVQIKEHGGRWMVSVRHPDGQATLTCDELVVATGKNAIPRMPRCYDRLDLQTAPIIHSSQLQGHRFQQAVSAAAGQLLVVGFGNSAADICSLILRQAPSGSVHVSMRRLPPIVRRQWGPFRLEWFAKLFSLACDKNGDRLTHWLMYMIEGDMQKLFPDLDTWGARKERHIPTVDRDGSLLRHVREERIVPHQDIEKIELCKHSEDPSETKVEVKFAGESDVHTFDFVILCTGYESSLEAQSCLSTAEVLGRAHFVGLGPEPKDLLPLVGIGREARTVATQISDLLHLKRRRDRCRQPGSA